MLIRSTGGHFDLNEVVGTQLEPCKCAFRVEITCNLGLSSDIKTSPFFQPTYFTLPATEQTFTHQLTLLCDLTVGLPDHVPIQFCSMNWCHQTQFYLLSCIWQWYHHVFTPAFTPNIFKQYATPCPLILVATVRLVPTTYRTHIFPELKCHKAESSIVCSVPDKTVYSITAMWHLHLVAKWEKCAVQRQIWCNCVHSHCYQCTVKHTRVQKQVSSQ